MQANTILLILSLLYLSLGFNLEVKDEACGWTNHCPIESAGSTPICAVTDIERIDSTTCRRFACGSESPSIWGGSFTVGADVNGTIT
jgi:hypothetical protein